MSRIFITGDIHGIASDFTDRVNWYINKPKEDDIIICVGDVGLEYGNKIQGALKKAMRKFPGTIYVMRGNHDNRYWAAHTKRPTEGWIVENNLLYQDKYPNIKYIKDEGGIYKINNHTFLFIPGAYSVDKWHRLYSDLPYEPKEQLTWLECESILSEIDSYHSLGKKIDYVCSHTAPLCMQNYFEDLFLGFIDQSRVDNYMEQFLDEIYATVGREIKRWYFGHYHDSRNISLNFTMLYHKVVQLGDKV